MLATITTLIGMILTFMAAGFYKNGKRQIMIVGSIMSFLAGASSAKAEIQTKFIKDKPAQTITAAQAAKEAKGAYKCDRVGLGNAGNPKKVKGSKTFWVASISGELQETGLENGEKVYRCKLMSWDKDANKMRGVDAEESEVE